MKVRSTLKGAGVAWGILALGIWNAIAAEQPTYKVGDTVDLNKIALQDLQGKALKWDTYKNKILVLNYFATW